MGQEEDEELLAELKEGFAVLEEKVEETRMTTLLSGEYDNSNAILQFHAGAGGTEAQDWAQMLYRMYTRWAERHGFVCDSQVAGAAFQSVAFRVYVPGPPRVTLGAQFVCRASGCLSCRSTLLASPRSRLPGFRGMPWRRYE